jgi:hypothetical protein
VDCGTAATFVGNSLRLRGRNMPAGITPESIK